jgi:uncharacterized protein
MKIILTDILGNGGSYSCLESLDSLQCDFSLKSPVVAILCARQQSEEKYVLSGTVKASVETSCDRCGKEISLHVNRKFQYILYIGQEPECNAEYQCNDDDCEMLYLDEAAIECKAIVVEQLLLAMPVQRLCGSSCKGLCKECGTNLNEKMCKCGEFNSNSPFAILKKLQHK